MIVLTALALWLLLLTAPKTPIGRFLYQMLVAAPATRLGRITRGQMLLVLLLCIGSTAIVWLMGGEALRLLGMAVPDVAMWVTTFEITTYLDVVAALAMAASTMRAQLLVRRLRDALPYKACRPGKRAARSRRIRHPARAKADNDDDRPVIAAAA
jgi:hypothetical protein